MNFAGGGSSFFARRFATEKPAILSSKLCSSWKFGAGGCYTGLGVALE
jgi:hypothetical protein